MAADGGEHLYQQNHCGVYRSTDGGRAVGGDHGRPAVRVRLPDGRPSARPDDGLDDPAHRAPRTAGSCPTRRAAVWRTNDGGDSWIRSGEGLPQHDAYVGVLREAMAVDRLDPVGVYFGTSTGQLYGSADEGRTWSLIADNLPPIWSVEAAVVG